MMHQEFETEPPKTVPDPEPFVRRLTKAQRLHLVRQRKITVAVARAKVRYKYIERHPDTDSLPDWRWMFLVYLERFGSPVRAAWLTKYDRTAAYEYRKSHPQFARAWDEAILAYKDGLDVDLGEMAKKGDLKALLAKLRAELPGKYGPRPKTVTATAQQITVVNVHRPPESPAPPEPVVATEPPKELPAPQTDQTGSAAGLPPIRMTVVRPPDADPPAS
jgi:hypothetical protein